MLFMITVSPDLAVGVIFTTRKHAETAAYRMGLKKYEIVQAFYIGEKVIFHESETGSEKHGTISDLVGSTFYKVALEDGTTVETNSAKLTAAAA